VILDRIGILDRHRPERLGQPVDRLARTMRRDQQLGGVMGVVTHQNTPAVPKARPSVAETIGAGNLARCGK